ncbi:MAG: hypothetical protein IJM29_00600 [Bacteroidales bacterium]|nr:hypothetical protein [Bacteroidales bacterium]
MRVTSSVEISSNFIFMAVQRPGKGLQNLTNECKSKAVTCLDCTSVISKVMKECGALLRHRPLGRGSYCTCRQG